MVAYGSSRFIFVLSPHTKKHTQTTTHTTANRRHHPRHLSMVPFWSDVIAVKDNHGVVCCLCHHIASPRPLVLSLRWLCCTCLTSVDVLSCPVLSSSHRAGWLLRVPSPLSLYPVAPPSCPLVAPVASVVLSSSLCSGWLLHVPLLPYVLHCRLIVLSCVSVISADAPCLCT